jgi:D-glycerate 3-kinase
LRAEVLALDDFYLTRAEREGLAQEIHPLLLTRGPPGTHDPQLATTTIQALARPAATPVPRFDKGVDDRLPSAEWPIVEGPADIIFFEGWCVGARPQPSAALDAPVNELERLEDPDRRWRTFVNEALSCDYQSLFALVDVQVLFCAPSFGTVLDWRLQQEHKLRARRPGAGQTDAEIARFVQHYERLTRHIAAEMPPRADVLVRLAPDRSLETVAWRRAYSTIAE